MYYVGIDIAKRSSVACVLRDDNTIVVKPFEFSTEESGFQKLLAHLQALSCDLGDIIIGMEATGLLFENLYRYLKTLTYRVVLLNPYQTAKFREMDTMKRVKNDNIDALMIAALIKSGRFSEGYVTDDQLASLRELYRHRASLDDQRKAIKRQTQTLLAVVFPEFEKIINDPFSVTGMALLEKYPTAKHYDQVTPEKILKIFRGIKGNNFNEHKAQMLLGLASKSVYSGAAQEARALSIRSNIALLKMIDQQIMAIDEQIHALFDQKHSAISPQDHQIISDIIDHLRTIPGVGDKTILALLAECGPLDRFPNAAALVGYLGLYPTIEQSGGSIKHKHLAKRGAKLAKKALYLAAIAAIRHNSELYTIYSKYRSKGRAKKECLIIVARKLVQIIYAIYTQNIPYDPLRVFVAQPVRQSSAINNRPKPNDR
ncbi:MAG: IS110 family transposase [Campylobacterales bacterium]